MALQQLIVFNHDGKEGWISRTFPSLICTVILYCALLDILSFYSQIKRSGAHVSVGSPHCLGPLPRAQTPPWGHSCPPGHLRLGGGVTALQDAYLDLTYQPTCPPHSREGPKWRKLHCCKKALKGHPKNNRLAVSHCPVRCSWWS